MPWVERSSVRILQPEIFLFFFGNDEGVILLSRWEVEVERAQARARRPGPKN